MFKKCTKCGQTKDVSQFGRSASRSDGFNNRCKECLRIPDALRKQRRREADFQKICPICNEPFSVGNAYATRVQIYCSRQCWKKAVEKRAICGYCKSEFVPSKKSTKFCSKGCADKSLRIEHHSQCANCHTDFVRKLRIKSKRLFCSEKCLNEYRRGPKHPNWKGGHEKYYGENWLKQRAKAIKRDHNQCQICKTFQNNHRKTMDVHHRIAFREFGLTKCEEANDLSNLICLCRACHTNVEHNGVACP